MEQNLRLYPWYRAASSFLTWMPIFFLYFSEQMGLKELLLLEAIYYFAVVLIEVPSGYFSDVIGRKITLLFSTLFFLAACVLFWIGGNFLFLVAAQVAFAGFMAFQSGTNTVFHFESLQAAGLSEEYGDREAHVGKLSMLSGAFAALTGGFLGSYDLRYPFVAAFIVGLAALYMVLRFETPKTPHKEKEQAANFWQQLRWVFAYLKNGKIAWAFFYFVFFYALVHIPYEFYQPYLKLLEGQNALPGTDAPLISGIIYAATFFVGAFVSAKSMVLKRKLGLQKLLLVALLGMILVIGIMGSTLSIFMVGIMLLRNSPMSAIRAPYNAYMTPQIAESQRATFYSVQSLMGRLAFFATLFGLSFFVETDQLTDWPTLSYLFKVCLLVACLLAFPIILTAGKFLAINENETIKE